MNQSLVTMSSTTFDTLALQVSQAFPGVLRPHFVNHCVKRHIVKYLLTKCYNVWNYVYGRWGMVDRELLYIEARW